MAILRVVEASGAVSDREVDSESLVIGRSSKLDVTLADRSLSRQHARIFRAGGSWLVEDLGSRNGTFVNLIRVDGPRALRPGDQVSIGSCTLELILGEESPHVQPSSAPSEAGQTLLRSAAELLRENLPGSEIGIADDERSIRKLADRLRILNEVHQALDQSIELEELLELILDRVFDHLHPEEGAIFLRRRDGSAYLAAGRSRKGHRPTGLKSQSLFEEVIERGQAALVLDTESDQRFNQAESLLGVGLRSLVAAPLLDSGGAVGMIVLGSTVSLRLFSEQDMELLTSLASAATMRIQNVRLAEGAAERKQLEQEVKLARHIQVALLPQVIPQPNGYAIRAGNIPSRGVSGDIYKLIERSDGSECAILLADVSGKGMAAALLTASLEALSAGPIEDGMAPDEICRRVSRLLFARTPPEKYATAVLAILEIETGTLSYVNAGHNPGLLVRTGGETRWLSSTGPPLGILPVAAYAAEEVRLQPGDTVLLYTDGITEAENPEEEEYGQDRLHDVGQAHHSATLAEIAAAVEFDVENFARGVPPADDRTLVMVRRLAGAKAAEG